MILINEKGDHVSIDPWYDAGELWASKAFHDKLDDALKRIRDLESDVEYYKYEASRTW